MDKFNKAIDKVERVVGNRGGKIKQNIIIIFSRTKGGGFETIIKRLETCYIYEVSMLHLYLFFTLLYFRNKMFPCYYYFLYRKRQFCFHKVYTLIKI